MLRKLFRPKKEEVTAGYRYPVMRNIIFCTPRQKLLACVLFIQLNAPLD